MPDFCSIDWGMIMYFKGKWNFYKCKLSMKQNFLNILNVHYTAS